MNLENSQESPESNPIKHANSLKESNYFKQASQRISPPNRKISGNRTSGEKNHNSNVNVNKFTDMNKVVRKPAKNISTLKLKEFYSPDALTEVAYSSYSMDKSMYSRMEVDHNIENFV